MASRRRGKHRGRSTRRFTARRLVIGAVVLVLGLVTSYGLLHEKPSARADARSAGENRVTTSGSHGASAEATGDALPITDIQTPATVAPSFDGVGVPVSIAITRLGIHSSLQRLGVLKDGTLQSPSDYNVAGWFAAGTRPGDTGPAVIAGHVDSTTGPAVFYRLPTITVGDEVSVLDDHGVSRRFSVYDVETYPKSAFPTEAIYGPTGTPVLRLITCYGAFDSRTKSYVDNVVVSAALET